MSLLTTCESQETWKIFHGEGPSLDYLLWISSDDGNCMKESSDAVFTQLREQETIPSNATSTLISLDRVLVQMIDEMVNCKTQNASWSEASLWCGCTS